MPNGVQTSIRSLERLLRMEPVNVNGAMANLMTYNGYFPGPTINVKKGDILRINFSNYLPHPRTRRHRHDGYVAYYGDGYDVEQERYEIVVVDWLDIKAEPVFKILQRL